MDPAAERRAGTSWPRTGLVLAWIAILWAGVNDARWGLLRPEESYSRADEATAHARMPSAAYAALYRVVHRSRPPSWVLAEMEAYREGSVSRRLRFAVLQASVQGPKPAGERLKDLDTLLATGRLRADGKEAEVRRILGSLYLAPPAENPGDLDRAVARLPPGDAAFLRRELGWFGKLALEPGASYTAEALARVGDPDSGRWSALHLGYVFLHAIPIFLGWLLLLVVLPVLAFRGSFLSRLVPPFPAHGVLAEAAGLLMLVESLVPLRQLLPPGRIGALVCRHSLSFLALGSALAWPLLRRIPWREFLEAAGWRRNGRVGRDIAIGVLAYLPYCTITHLLAMILPAGPAHGSTTALDLNSGVPARWLLAAGGLLIVAPLLEETCYRGLIYRHLREAFRPAGAAAGIFLGILISGSLFAAAHTGGWYGFGTRFACATVAALLLDWRGAIWAPLAFHFTANLGYIAVTSILPA